MKKLVTFITDVWNEKGGKVIIATFLLGLGVIVAGLYLTLTYAASLSEYLIWMVLALLCGALFPIAGVAVVTVWWSDGPAPN